MSSRNAKRREHKSSHASRKYYTIGAGVVNQNLGSCVVRLPGLSPIFSCRISEVFPKQENVIEYKRRGLGACAKPEAASKAVVGRFGRQILAQGPPTVKACLSKSKGVAVLCANVRIEGNPIMSVQDKKARNRQQLQRLLRELFQFDAADLDFGIYRILNAKRDEVECFIERDLLDAVEEGLAHFRAAEREDLEVQLAEKRVMLGEAALDETGAVREAFAELPIAQEYTRLRQQLQRLDVAEETEARVFNDLYTFFSRYYDDGDFLTERRYSSRGPKFCVPYGGEEVMLHWANRDQYYVKTSERFTDYRFTAGEHTVWFRLQHADVLQDNVKANGARYFVLRAEEPLVYDAETRTLTVFFEYRPLAEEEEARYLALYNARQSRSSRRKTLDRVALCMALEAEILGGLDDPTLKAHLAAVPGGEAASPLGLHLNRYTARNTMDYFVHKDLGGFLRRELDFFLKNEVLRIDDVVGDPTGEVMQHVVSRMRVVRQIALKIIAFLAQIEDFQKRLFEKRKFVVQTDYCITLDRVPAALYPEILANERQLEAWRRLYAVDAWDETLFWQGAFDAAFLANHPYVMIDTAFFDDDFRARLLASFEDLDGAVDGVLVCGENFQALNVLREKWQGRIKCVHIDPPYNTQTSGFLYKNNYQHSSWLAMMDDRIRAGISMLSSDGSFQCHIDENEYERLLLLFECFQIPDAGTIVWDKRNPMNAGQGIATQHEYIIFRSWQEGPIYLHNENILSMLKAVKRIVQKHGSVTEEARSEYVAWLNNNPRLSGGEKAYRYLDDEGRIYQSVSLRAPEPRTHPKFFKPLIHPVTGKPCAVPPNGFSRTPETLQTMIDQGEILFGVDETTQPRQKMPLTQDSRRQIPSLIQDGRKGKSDVSPLALDFPYCHPVSLYKELIGAVSHSLGDVILDFFAGSGTTAHAVINLNREDGGSRKYILVEVGEHFDTVLKPRIQKVVFSPNWKDGIPQDRDGVSHVFKYQRIESYEDALNNIRVRPPEGAQRRLLDAFDDYMLHYMLDFETRDSPTLLSHEAFETPFAYTLQIQRGHESPQDTVVDLVETFHYLIGMHVRRLERHEHQGRAYVVSRGEVRTERGVEETVVVWRDTPGLDLDQEADWANEALLAEPADRVYVNGPSHIRQAQPLEIAFRQRMDVKE
ncbi:MAG: site-specific DNA-methyltransferase [Anaerolineae bacterium]|nr:site-specific DNA-methyltransferase [Anaerolineae bacterium]